MRVVLPGGPVFELGTTESAPTIGIIDYSRRVTDDFGVTTVLERGFARRMSVRLAVPFAEVDALQRRLAGLRATPAQWIADDRFDSLMVEGFYKDFSLDLAVPPQSYCTLTIEGLAETGTFIDPGGDPAPDGQVSTLRLLHPIDVTDAVLISSSVAESDYPEWSASTSYAIGARVIKAATHRVYESTFTGNINNDPATSISGWIDVGATNRWAMFDQAIGSLTTAIGSIVVTLDPATVTDGIALLDVDAEQVRVQAIGYDRTASPVSRPGMVTFLDIPATEGAVVITVTGSGPVAVGTLLLGGVVSLGVTEAAPTAAITDYSRKETDDFGEVTVVERAWTKRMSVNALLRTDAVDLVAGRVAAVRARPSLWIGDQAQESITIYGFFKEFSITVGDSVSTLALSVEGFSEAAKIAPLKLGEVSWNDVIDDDPAHPKPDDGADVTGDNVALDTQNVGGRPATQVLGDADQLSVDTAAAQAAIVTAQGNIATIFQEIDDLDEALGNISVTVTQAGGNLAPNPDFGVDSAGWSVAQSGTSHSGARDLAGDAWRPINEHNLGLYQSNDNSADYAYWQTAKIAVAANSWQEFSAYGASHRCEARLLLRFWPADGGGNIDYYSAATQPANSGGTKLDDWGRLVVKRQMPNQSGTVELYFIKNGTQAGNADSYAWMLRPQLVETTADSVSPVRYYPGSGTATVRQQATAIAGVQAQGASLEANLAVAGAEIDSLQTVATTTTGKVAQIETRLRAGSPNLLKNGGLANGFANVSHDGTFFLASNAWGPQAYSVTNGTRVFTFDPVGASPGETFTMAVDPLAFGAGSWTYVDMIFQDAAGSVVPGGDSPQNLVYGGHDFDPTTDRRALIAVSAMAPAGTAKVVGRFIANCVNGGPVGFRLAKLERAATWSAFSDEASVQQVWSAYSGLNSQYAGISTTVSIQGVTITEQAEAIATQNGQINTLFGRWSAVVDVAGYVTSLEANNNGSYSAWKFRANELTIEDPGGGGFQLANGRIRITAGGGFMKVTGDGFGSSGQFIDWYGPFFSNLSNCTEANAISYQTVDGRAYHGGGISAGILYNAYQSSDIATNAVLTTGQFGSNGDAILIAVTWTYIYSITKNYAANSTGLSQFNADVASFAATSSDGGFSYVGSTSVGGSASLDVDRDAGGGFADFSNGSSTGGTGRFEGTKPIPAAGEPGLAYITFTHTISFTSTDTLFASLDRRFRATLNRGFSYGGGSAVQRISLIATEG